VTPRRVSVATLGGTITMTSPSPGASVVPTQSAQELLAATPELAGLADLTVETLFTKPGASLRFGELLDVLDWGEQRVRQGADGIVVVQGTDTLEESAYLLDLLWPHEEPLVLTGAMRTPDQASPDGPANLTAAIVVACAQASRGLGAVVVINDEIHAARRVRKQDSIALGAFSSVSSDRSAASTRTTSPSPTTSSGPRSWGRSPARTSASLSWRRPSETKATSSAC